MLVSLSCSQNHTSRMDNWNSSTAAVFTTTLELCCRKQRSKLSLTNVTHQPHALHPPVPAHRLHKQQKGESTAPTMRITTNPAHSHKKQCRPLTHVRGAEGAHLPKRVVVGLAREATDENRAVGVAGGLGVAERVVWNGTGGKPM
jgi:hypothetical protein